MNIVTKEKKTTKPNKNRNLIFFYFIQLIIFVAVVFVWNLERINNKDINLKINNNESNILKINTWKKDVLKNKTTTTKKNKEDIEEKINRLEDKIVFLQQQELNNQEQKIENNNTLGEEVIFSEVDFLIRQASIYYVLNNNQKTTPRLLNAALSRLKTIKNANTILLRKAIQEDLLMLKISFGVDITATYISLDTILKNMETWPEKSLLILENNNIKKPIKAAVVKQGWLLHLKQSTKKVLKKWFQVVQHKERVTPLVSAKQSLYLKRTIKLLLEEAQWALLQGENKLYERLLTSVREKIKKTYNQSDVRVKVSLEEINKLIISNMKPKQTETLAAEKALTVFLKKSRNK